MPNLKHDPQKAAGYKGIKPQNQDGDGTVSGPWIDRDGFQSAKLVGLIGDATGSPSATSVTFKLRESDASDGSSPSDYATATANTGEDVQDVLNIDLSGAKRYVQPQAVVAFTAGSSPTIDVAAALILMGAVEPPVTDPTS